MSAVTSRFSEDFDFKNCEDEPIRTPGAIQPHGFVILLNEENHAVTGFSINAPEFVRQAFVPDTPAVEGDQLTLPKPLTPIHLQYLRNMDVAASMSISLIRGGKLWGLIACHHSEPRYVSMGARLSAKLVGDVLSLGLRLVEDAEIMGQRLQRRFFQNKVAEQCLKSDELVPTIAQAAQEFRQLFDARQIVILRILRLRPPMI